MDEIRSDLRHALRAAGYPDVDVTVEPYDPREAIEAVRRDLLDVAVVCLPAPVSGLRVTPIGEEGVVVALPEGHRLAGNNIVYWTDLKDETFLFSQRDPGPEIQEVLLAKLAVPGERFRQEPGRTLHDFLKRDQTWTRKSPAVAGADTG